MLTSFESELQTTGSVLQWFYRKTVILCHIKYHNKNQTSDQRRKEALASVSSIALHAHINLLSRIIRRTPEAD